MAAPEIKQYGIVRNGQRIYYSPDLHLQQIKSLEAYEFEEIIKKRVKKPSLGTHGYYRGGIIATCLTTNKFSGWTKSEVDKFFCNLFLKEIIEKIFPDGKKVEIPFIKSTGDLDQQEMNEFIIQVEQWCSENEIEILSPEQYNLTKYRIIKKTT
jgi:hypothetical protein